MSPRKNQVSPKYWHARRDRHETLASSGLCARVYSWSRTTCSLGERVLPEFHRMVGEKCFGRLMDVFAGITVTFPSESALEKMRKSREFLNGLNDEKQAFFSEPA